jgi:hypothetical protein
MSLRINHVAVVVSAIVFFLVSYAWYDFLFGKIYEAQMAKMGVATGMSTPMTAPLIGTFLLGWFLAYVIAVALSMRPDPNPGARGFGFGLFIGVGVYASMTLLGVLWGGLPFALWAVNAGFVIVVMAIMGWIIGSWSAKTATATA